MRIVSLVPSATETLRAWGITPVACTRFCEQPSLRHVGGTKDPDVAAIVDMAPDVVVVDREENRREDAEALIAAGLHLLVLHVRSVDGLAGELQRLAAAVGAPEPVVDLPPPAPPWGRVVTLVWRRPWMALGTPTYGASMLARLGLEPALPAELGVYPALDLAAVAATDPDVVVLPSEPYPFAERHLPEVRAAMPRAAVALVDGQDLLWWGARTGAASRRLAAVTAGLRAAPPHG